MTINLLKSDTHSKAETIIKDYSLKSGIVQGGKVWYKRIGADHAQECVEIFVNGKLSEKTKTALKKDERILAIVENSFRGTNSASIYVA